MNEEFYKKTVTLILLLSLIALSFLLVKPILLSALLGVILAFIFLPVYTWINRYITSKNLSASILCTFLILLIILPFWFFTPILVDQSIKIYLAVQQADFVTPLKAVFPKIFASERFSAEVGSILYSFVTKITNSVMNCFSNLILNSPTLFLQSLVTLFTFFFVLRDKEEFLVYLETLLPFSDDVKKKLFKKTQDITVSVLYGQIILGIIQGVITGIGFFVFGIPNALFLTLLAIVAGIFPIIGTTVVWIPLVVYLIIQGNIIAVVGISLFGIFASIIENVSKPIFISRRSKMHSSLILFGMVGGVFLFGVLGFILGPLILAYLFILVEFYKGNGTNGIFKIPYSSK